MSRQASRDLRWLPILVAVLFPLLAAHSIQASTHSESPAPSGSSITPQLLGGAGGGGGGDASDPDEIGIYKHSLPKTQDPVARVSASPKDRGSSETASAWEMLWLRVMLSFRSWMY